MSFVLYYRPDCGCKKRKDKWMGALLNRQDIGCAINVLVFLEAIDEHFGMGLIPTLDPRVGTPFSGVIAAIQPYCGYPLQEQKHHFSDLKTLTEILDAIEEGLKDGIKNENHKYGNQCSDACTIIKLHRAVGGVGHTVIMSFEDGHMYTVDPQAETQAAISEGGGGKIIRKRNDAKIFKAWVNTFVAISVILAKVPKSRDTPEPEPELDLMHIEGGYDDSPKAAENSSDEFVADNSDSDGSFEEVPSDSDDSSVKAKSHSRDSPVHGINPNKPMSGNFLHTVQPYIGDPTDLTKRGKVYAVLGHGSLFYAPKPDDGHMPKDGNGQTYDIECLTIPKNIVILTLTSVGQPLSQINHTGYKHLRTAQGLPYHATMGKFRYERWGAQKGKSHFQFPNYAIQNEWIKNQKSAMGIYQRTGPTHRDMRKIYDLETKETTISVPFYCYDTHKILDATVRKEMSCLRDAIDIIKRDAGSGNKIYIFCNFCLGGVAPESLAKVRRCCDPSSIDAALPGITIAAKKKSTRRSKRKNTRKKTQKAVGKKYYGIKNNKVIQLYPHKIKKSIGRHKYIISWKTTKGNISGKTFHGKFYMSKQEAMKNIK